MPNYYGAQRFGISGGNALRGREVLVGRGPRQRWLRRFLLAAYQSAPFNAWLAERVRRGWVDYLSVIKDSPAIAGLCGTDQLGSLPRFHNHAGEGDPR